MATTGCRVTMGRLGRALETVSLENELLRATVLVTKGGDIYSLEHRPSGTDLLWKSPWGVRDPVLQPLAPSSTVAWFDLYSGGWPVLFPNGADACVHRGVELGWHGEASVSPWSCEIVAAGGEAAEIRLWLRLARSPFRIERSMRVEAGRPVLTIAERVTNEGGESLEYMWTHHPTFGPPFLGPACRIDTDARSVRADDRFDGPFNPVAPGTTGAWPRLPARDGGELDLSRAPDPSTPRHLLAYLGDFERGWYAVTNPDLRVGFGLTWPATLLPYAWLWQEAHASIGYPWYGNTYGMALEPSTSFPGQGLVNVMKKTGTHRTLPSGGSESLTLRAVVYDSATGVKRIGEDGTVEASDG